MAIADCHAYLSVYGQSYTRRAFGPIDLQYGA